MDPVVNLVEDQLVVEPGGQVSTVVRVRNTSDVVTEYDLTVLGEIAAYTEIVPAQLSVYVGDVMEATVVIRPPYDTMISSGQIPFAVRAQSREDADRIGIIEGELTVGAINLLQAKLLPAHSSGRRRAKARMEIHNQGTEAMTVRLRTVDPDEKLSFALSPRELDVAAGATADAFLKVRPRKSMVMGTATQIPFQVSYRRKAGLRDAYLGATTAGETEAFVHSTFEQKPMVARWMIGVFALVALLAGLFIYRAQTTEIDATPERPIEAPRPPSNVTVVPSIGGLSVSWDAPSPEPAGFRLVSLDPEQYARGTLDLLEEPRVLNGSERSIPLEELGEGETRCLFVQSTTGEDEGGPKSVLVGPASPAGLDPVDLPPQNCVSAGRADQCADPVVTRLEPENRPADPRLWIIEWTYDDGCATASEAEWTITVNGQAVEEFDNPEQRRASIVLDVPSQGEFRVGVSAGEGLPPIEKSVAADVVDATAEELEAVAAGAYDPLGSYAIITALQPATQLKTTGEDSIEAWFEQIRAGLVSDSDFDVDDTRVRYGPISADELPDSDSSNMDVLLIEADDDRAYYLIVDGHPSLASAQTLCDNVASLVAGVTETFAQGEFFGVLDPEPCRAVGG